jgi:ABC-type branched-subunit amino acid transport system substrate-binding protein
VNRVLGRDDVQGRVAAQFARQELRATTAFVVHDRTEYGQGGAEVFQQVAGKIGLTLVGYEGFPGYERTQAPDFGTIIRRMAASQPDVVYFGGIYDQAAILFKQARAQGVRAAFLGPDGLDSADLGKLAGQAVVGLHYVTQAGPIESYPEAREFAKEFQRRFGKQAGPFVAEAYDATLVGLRAIELALQGTGGRRPTRKEVCEAIRRLPGTQGLTGPISFDARGDRKLARYFVRRVESPNPAMWDYNRLVTTIEAPPAPTYR